MKNQLDIINRKILISIQHDARKSIADVAQIAGLSTSPCHKRIKAMEKSNVILGYVANLDLARICTTVTFLTEVTLKEHNPYSFRKFEEVIRKEEALVECYQVSGHYDYFARFICRDVDDYKGVTQRLTEQVPISNIQSQCVMSKVKKFSGYPLEHLLDLES